MSFLRHFGDGFESGHKIWHDLKRQQDRNEGSGAKCRMKIDGGAANGANAQENHEEKKYDPRRPILKSGAPADSPVVQHCKKHRKPHAQQQTRKKNGFPRHSVQFVRIQRRKNVRCKFSERHRFPRANDEVRQQHHPASEITHNRWKDLRGVGSFAGGVRKALYPLAVDIANGQQQQAPSRKTKNCAERSAASRSEEHTSELQSPYDLVCRLLLEKKIC